MSPIIIGDAEHLESKIIGDVKHLGSFNTILGAWNATIGDAFSILNPSWCFSGVPAAL